MQQMGVTPSRVPLSILPRFPPDRLIWRRRLIAVCLSDEGLVAGGEENRDVHRWQAAACRPGCHTRTAPAVSAAGGCRGASLDDSQEPVEPATMDAESALQRVVQQSGEGG
jgi:hypothetical protein